MLSTRRSMTGIVRAINSRARRLRKTCGPRTPGVRRGGVHEKKVGAVMDSIALTVCTRQGPPATLAVKRGFLLVSAP